VSTLIVGCGYLGRRVGAWLARRGEPVHGTVRSPQRAGELAQLGITPVIANVLQPETLGDLPEAERVLYCVAFDPAGGADRRAVSVDGLRNVLDRLPASVSRLVHASSTSVYGQTGGEWVDEGSATEPRSEPGRVCLEAERIVGGWGPGGREVSRVILRFAGLYGPGRVIRRALLERGEPIPGDPTRLLNLIHIDDAAQAAVAALDAPRPGPIYVVADDRPVPRIDYYTLTARLLGAPEPRFVPSRGDDAANRRALNRKLREHLGVDLIYPDISSGVPAALGVSAILLPTSMGP
jgi:nucleoside-diphosphate-sugar epimerase